MDHQRAGDMGQAWGRVTGWLEQHGPDVLAALGGPGSRTALYEAELRMGLRLPRQMRQWLLANDLDAGRQPHSGSGLVALGCPGVVPGGGLLLGLVDIERVYFHKTALEETAPSGDGDCPSWRRAWVPILSERDGAYGKFVDTSTGAVGSWSEGSFPEVSEYVSLSAFFQDVADQLEGAPWGDRSGPGGARRLAPRPEDEPVRLWARANGYLVNDRGRVPAAVREAYEASR
ncbi:MULTISPECIES: Lsr2 family DNA-binding protein [Streptomyces]|uniref:Histone-like nucleoid-structuring protein Lsr2 n=1 Tax=Streptomyces lienomycini TaxID=284035 RepID=A0ABV9X5H9_9ACTN|nr:MULTISPECIES: histone-like nucleoid-structuring protein Lsr2 [Streptomyces]